MKRTLLIVGACFALVACSNYGNVQASDPTERWCSYIACAITLHAIFRLFA